MRSHAGAWERVVHKMLTKLRHLLEMIRFSHTLFALPFALLAAMMAWAANARSTPPLPFAWRELLGIVLCMVFARSAAMAFNRLADRRIDAANPRTKTRHLPAGVLSFCGVRVRIHREHAFILAAKSDSAHRLRAGAAFSLFV